MIRRWGRNRWVIPFAKQKQKQKDKEQTVMSTYPRDETPGMQGPFKFRIACEKGRIGLRLYHEFDSDSVGMAVLYASSAARTIAQLTQYSRFTLLNQKEEVLAVWESRGITIQEVTLNPRRISSLTNLQTDDNDNEDSQKS